MVRRVCIFGLGIGLALLLVAPGCDPADPAAAPANPWEAELERLRSRIAELRSEYEQNRAKLRADLRVALDKVEADKLDSTDLARAVTEMTQAVQDETGRVEQRSRELRATMRDLGIPAPKPSASTPASDTPRAAPSMGNAL